MATDVAGRTRGRFPLWTTLLTVICLVALALPSICFGIEELAYLGLVLVAFFLLFCLERTKPERMAPGHHPYLATLFVLVLANLLFSFPWVILAMAASGSPAMWMTQRILLDGPFFFLWIFLWVFASVGALERKDQDSGKGLAAAVGGGLGGSVAGILLILESPVVTGQRGSEWADLSWMLLSRALASMASLVLAWAFLYLQSHQHLRLKAGNHVRISLWALGGMAVCALVVFLQAVLSGQDPLGMALAMSLLLGFLMLAACLWEAASLEGMWGVRFLG